MAGALGSNWVRVGGYAVTALVCAWASRREARWLRAGGPSHLWPRFWVLTALLLGSMALGRAADLGELLAELGREQARSEGWYDVRRSFQAMAVGVVTLAWAVAVLAAIWRVPPRRRRYLPPALVVATLIGFAVLRMISLHQIDSALHRTELAGVRVGALIELALIVAAVVTTLWAVRPATAAPPPATPVSVSPS